MNAYTRQDLSVMQAWPLERKIRVTQAKIIEWYHHYGGKVAVSFSGGKDSTVLLDLARRAFPDIPAVFVDTGLEYPEIREFVKTVPNVTWLRPEMPFSKVILEYGYPVISKDVARRIRYARKGGTWVLCHLNGLNRDGTPSKYNERYMKWRILLDAPFFVSDQCCFIMKERPLHRYNRETGRKQIIATMACESARRQSVYLKIGCNAYQRQFMPEDTKAGLIQSFLDNYSGTQVCSKLIYAEALNHSFDEPKQWEIREINEIMNNSIEGWTAFSNPRTFARYGRQRGWERAASGNEPAATGSILPGGFRELTEEEASQMELPF